MDGTVMNVRGVDIRVGDLIHVEFQHSAMLSAVLYEGTVMEVDNRKGLYQRFVIKGTTQGNGDYWRIAPYLYQFTVTNQIHSVKIKLC